MALYLAADIGGTKLAAGVVTDEGEILSRRARATPRVTDGEALYDAFRVLLRDALASASVVPSEVRAVGVGCGGPMRYPDGLVSPLNIPAWRDFPLRPRLQADFDAPTLVDNDAKAFALGEHWLGAGRGARCLMAMVVSTGVGGGIVEDGRLLHGAHGNAGHIGHITVFPNGPRCACGARGCLEAVASGPNLASWARELLLKGISSQLPSEPTTHHLVEAAEAGDRLALQVFRRAGVALGRGIAAATSLFDLDRVVLGGGVSGASARFFLPALRTELAARAQLGFAREVEVALSRGTIDSALLGAARLVGAGR